MGGVHIRGFQEWEREAVFAPGVSGVGLAEVAFPRLDQPTAAVTLHGRLHVAERSGIVREFGVAEPRLDIRDRVRSTGIEEGLLGLAADEAALYVHYVGLDGSNVVERYDQITGESAVLWSRPDDVEVHNGGGLAFGPDGALYVSLGDGARDHGDRSGHRDLAGTIFRLDPSGPTIVASGLRNPWRFAFDDATGDLWIADVGTGEREEVDVVPAGIGLIDFGWPRFEGTVCMHTCEQGGVMPLVEYLHGSGRCAIIGGHVYRGRALPALAGRFVFGDWCSGDIWSASLDEPGRIRSETSSGLLITGFGRDDAGEIYVLGMSGELMQLVPR